MQGDISHMHSSVEEEIRILDNMKGNTDLQLKLEFPEFSRIEGDCSSINLGASNRPGALSVSGHEGASFYSKESGSLKMLGLALMQRKP